MSSSTDILTIKNLGVSYGNAQVLDDVNLSVAAGEIVGIVGESGSGKSTLLQAIACLLPRTASVISGTIHYRDRNIERLSAKAMCSLRGTDLGFLFQNAENSFDPLFSVRRQFDEVLRAHKTPGNRSDYETIQCKSLARVGLTDSQRILDSLPSQLSGGMNQRIALAFALALEPQLLLADEPTSALDGSAQKNVIEILRWLNESDGLSILMVSHDIELVGSLADKITVMHEGRIVETGPANQILHNPQQPYTQELIRAIPHIMGQFEITPLGGDNHAARGA